ncbi:MAG: 3-deoxy-7-phosphoheptulonate synthase [Planctomycetota bacterium]|nr:3-deoxy-7-phosphoheptulonate synthase [Planctomycetota bacterium]
MIVVLRPGCSKEEIAHVEAHLKDLGFIPHMLYGVERTVIACIGDDRVTTKEHLEAVPGVERVMPVLAPYKLASREVSAKTTVMELGGPGPAVKPGTRTVPIGGEKLAVIAGPCSVEDRGMLLETAAAVKEAGAVALRAGAFKPRTSPYQFQGLAEEGLQYLAEAREQTGLPVITEVLTPADIKLVADYADCLQIGTRNMQNYLLLRACGESDRPVLLKRGMSATLEETLLAAEYILSGGNRNVLLCERGIRTFETHVRNTFALTAIPALKEKTHLPVLADPSHGTGVRRLVAPMTKAAVACGADGILIEVHPNPEKAKTDGQQTLDFREFAQLMRELKPLAEAVGRKL